MKNEKKLRNRTFSYLLILILISLSQTLLSSESVPEIFSQRNDVQLENPGINNFSQNFLKKWKEIDSHNFKFLRKQHSKEDLRLIESFKEDVKNEFIAKISGEVFNQILSDDFFYYYFNIIDENNSIEIDHLLKFYSTLSYIYKSNEGVRNPGVFRNKLIEVFKNCRDLLEAREAVSSGEYNTIGSSSQDLEIEIRDIYGLGEFDQDNILIIENIIDKSVDIFLKNPELQYFLRDNFSQIILYSNRIFLNIHNSLSLTKDLIENRGFLKDRSERLEWLGRLSEDSFIPGLEIFSQNRFVLESLFYPQSVSFEKIPFTSVLVRPKDSICLSCQIRTETISNILPSYRMFFDIDDSKFIAWNRDNRIGNSHVNSFERTRDLVNICLEYDNGRLRSFKDSMVVFKHYSFLSNVLFLLYDNYQFENISNSEFENFLFLASLDFYLKGANFTDSRMQIVRISDFTMAKEGDSDREYSGIFYDVMISRLKMYLTNMNSRIPIQDRINVSISFLNNSMVEHIDNSELFSVLAKFFYASGNQRCALSFLNRTGGSTEFEDLIQFSKDYPRFKNVSGELTCR